MTKRFLVIAGLSAVCALNSPAVRSQASADQWTSLDNSQAFLSDAMAANELMIRASRLAQERATDPAVRKLARALVQDHTHLQQRLQRSANGYNRSNDAPWDRAHAQQLGQIKSMAGPDFDKAYLQMIIRDHQQDLEHLQQMRQNGREGQLSGLVQDKLPMVRRHLKMARVAYRELQLALADRDGGYPNSVNTLRNARDWDSPIEDEKGDENEEFLGLPTSKDDGTVLGLFPAPSRTVQAGSRERYVARELADGQVDPGIETIEQADQETVGAPATAERERAGQTAPASLPRQVRNALQDEGWDVSNARVQKMTVYQVTGPDGERAYVTSNGKFLESQ